MSLSDAFENDLLKLILNGTAIGTIADNAAASPLATLYLSLHTGDPGEAGTQATSEVTYTGYARAPVARSSAGWTIAANVANLASAISFPQGTAGSGTAGYWAVGMAASGAGKILFSGPIAPTIATGAGVTPQLGTGTTITLD